MISFIFEYFLISYTHCQDSNPLRLAQEVDGWLREVLQLTKR